MTRTFPTSQYLRPLRLVVAYIAVIIGQVAAVAVADTRGSDSAEAASCETARCETARCEADIWIVNTRCLGCGCRCGDSEPQYQVLRWDASGEWQPAAIEELALAETHSVTAVYVHGNRIESNEVDQRVWQAYDGLSCGQTVPVRMVFWSWPSDKTSGQVRDVRRKLWRSDCEAYYLAHFLSRQSGRVALIGYSLGARIVTGALQLLGGGELGCHQFSGSAGELRPRVVLMAPAIRCGTLAPGGEMGLAVPQSSRLSILFNSLDPVLKRYWLLDVKRRPCAIGFLGQPSGCGGPEIEQVDVRCHIGRSHSESRYFNSYFVTEFLRAEIIAADQPLSSD